MRHALSPDDLQQSPSPTEGPPALRRRLALAALGVRGFTLVEAAVVIAVLSVIAIAVFPIVIQNSGKADPVRVAHDLASVRSAIDMFHLQVRPAYPRDLDDLVTGMTVSNTKLDGTNYTASEVAAWSGPYLDPSLTSTGRIRTGSNVEILNTFVLFDLDGNINVTTANASAAEFVGIRTTLMTPETFEAINDIIDGELEPDGHAEGMSSHMGRWRLVPTTPTLSTENVSGNGVYLAIPF